MRALALTVAAIALLAACSQLPNIKPSSIQSPPDGCAQLFGAGRWQYYHLIEASVFGRSMGRLTGVSVVSADRRTIDCALMTVEGLVLFSARYDGQLTVERAVAPFDRPGFAQGLVDDLMLLFLKPIAPLQIKGQLIGGEVICRYGAVGTVVTDIVFKDHGHWAIYSYNAQGRRQRTITGEGAAVGATAATHLTIQSHGRMEYVLKLELIEALQLNQ